jgi:hypothetical protein
MQKDLSHNDAILSSWIASLTYTNKQGSWPIARISSQKNSRLRRQSRYGKSKVTEIGNPVNVHQALISKGIKNRSWNQDTKHITNKEQNMWLNNTAQHNGRHETGLRCHCKPDPCKCASLDVEAIIIFHVYIQKIPRIKKIDVRKKKCKTEVILNPQLARDYSTCNADITLSHQSNTNDLRVRGC